MNSNKESHETEIDSYDLLRKFSYSSSLLEHWLEVFGIDYLLKLINYLRMPMKSLWIQVNTNKIDFDSLLEIFYEHDYIAKKHELFEDFIEMDIQQKDFDTQLENLPILRVDHESSTGIALGKDVQTADVTRYDNFETGDKVCVLDGASNVIAKGIAEVNSSEISNLTQRSVVKVKDSLAYAPPLTEMRIYRRGYFNILTPIQAIAVNTMSLGLKDNILVMSNDKGDVASYIAEKTQDKVPITVIAQNEMQTNAIRKNLERSNSKAIRVHRSSFLKFLNEHHEIKYTAVYLEPQNSRTAVIPVFSSNLSFGKLKQFAEKQEKIVTNLYKCLHKETSITYVTHSVDYLENEGVFKSTLEKAYYTNQKHKKIIKKLKDLNKISSRNVSSEYENIKEQLQESSIYLDPITTRNSGGFVCNFTLKEK